MERCANSLKEQKAGSSLLDRWRQCRDLLLWVGRTSCIRPFDHKPPINHAVRHTVTWPVVTVRRGRVLVISLEERHFKCGGFGSKELTREN